MNKIILLIEDDADIRESITDLLESEGYQLFTADNGLSGLKTLSTMNPLPSLILVDMMMPQMGGHDFCMEKSKIENYRQVPVVLMSADSDLEQKTKDAGATGYIKKPLDIYKLIAEVDKFIQAKA